jgi:hypothetical protein
VPFPVAAGGIVLVSYMVDRGGNVQECVSAGTGGIVLVYFSVGVLVPSSDPSMSRSIKCPRILLSALSVSFGLGGGVGGVSILLLPGDGSGTGI